MTRALLWVWRKVEGLARWLWEHPSVVVVFMLLFVLADVDYNGRQDTVVAQQKQCKHGIIERHTDLESWYGAYLARRAQAKVKHEDHTGVDYQAAQTYLIDVKTKAQRVDRASSLVWPDPDVPGVHGPYHYPLGYGTYSCDQAFPDAQFLPF